MWNKFKGTRASYVLLSILIAIFCWLYVDLAQKPDAEQTISNIPVTYVNTDGLEEGELLILDDTPVITVTVSGPRSVITKLDRDNIVITADTSSITGAGVYSLNCNITLPSAITSASDSPVRIVSRSASAIDVNVVKMVSKEVPIRAEFTGTVAEQRYYDENSFVLQQKELTIRGEESQVNAVSYAKVVLSETDLAETWTGWLNIVLCDQDGQIIQPDNLSLEVDAISVAFYVECQKEIDLIVGVISGGGATYENAKWTIDPPTITVYGQEVVLNNLDTLEVGKIDLGEILTTGQYTFDIELPDGVSCKEDVTEANVQVTIQGLETRKVTISKVQIINAPEGYTFEYAPLEVRVRGKAEDFELLMEDDIQVTLDLENVEITDGTPVTVAAQIETVGLPELGVLGSYHVELTPVTQGNAVTGSAQP